MWSLIGAAVLAAAGAVAALVRYRYRAEMETDTEDDMVTAAAPDMDETMQNAAAGGTTANGETPVNGRVSATGW